MASNHKERTQLDFKSFSAAHCDESWKFGLTEVKFEAGTRSNGCDRSGLQPQKDRSFQRLTGQWLTLSFAAFFSRSQAGRF